MSRKNERRQARREARSRARIAKFQMSFGELVAVLQECGHAEASPQIFVGKIPAEEAISLGCRLGASESALRSAVVRLERAENLALGSRVIAVFGLVLCSAFVWLLVASSWKRTSAAFLVILAIPTLLFAIEGLKRRRST